MLLSCMVNPCLKLFLHFSYTQGLDLLTEQLWIAGRNDNGAQGEFQYDGLFRIGDKGAVHAQCFVAKQTADGIQTAIAE